MYLVETIHDFIIFGDNGMSNLSTKMKFVTPKNVHLKEALDQIRNNPQLCH